MSIVIRECLAGDYPQLLEMETELINTMSKIDMHKRFRARKDLNAKKYFEALLKDLAENNGKIFVADIEGKLAGYIMGKVEQRSEISKENQYPATLGYIEGLFVDERHRSKGVSSDLIAEIEKYFKEQGCDYSSVACVAANDAARNLYTKSGYGEQYIDYLKKI